MAAIYMLSGPSEGDWYPVGHDPLVIGRDESLVARVRDGQVSRKHLTIAFKSDRGTWWAVDEASRNGVLVKGQRITREAQLVDGDVIQIGDSLLLFTTRSFDSAHDAMTYFKHAARHRESSAVLRALERGRMHEDAIDDPPTTVT